MSHVFSSTWLKSDVKIISLNGSVQTKPVQSKTASLGSIKFDLAIRTDWIEPYPGPGLSGLVESLVFIILIPIITYIKI